MNLFSVDELI